MPHHAYYIEGPLSDFEHYRADAEPFWAKKFDAFGIDDARKLAEFASLKNNAEALFLLGISSVTAEAQQALLKLFEEPVPGTTFILVLPHGVLLPTLRSRMLPYPAREVPRPADAPEHAGRALAESFLKAPQKSRSEMIARLLKDEEGARERAREFVDALEAALAPRLADPKAREGLQDIARVRDYLRDRSPSIKMLLEYLALCLPKN
jgi:hypothetical protein